MSLDTLSAAVDAADAALFAEIDGPLTTLAKACDAAREPLLQMRDGIEGKPFRTDNVLADAARGETVVAIRNHCAARAEVARLQGARMSGAVSIQLWLF